MSHHIRAATKGDADDLVRFIDWASEGIARMVWADVAEPGQEVMDVGRARALREEGSFTYRNAWVLDETAGPAAGLVGYVLPEPVEIGPDFPAAFVPLQELENTVPGWWYVNVLAAVPERRGAGLGTALLAHAEKLAQGLGCPGMAIIAFASNPGAVRLYERVGYVERDRRRVDIPGWEHSGTDAILLMKGF